MDQLHIFFIVGILLCLITINIKYIAMQEICNHVDQLYYVLDVICLIQIPMTSVFFTVYIYRDGGISLMVLQTTTIYPYKCKANAGV